MVLLKVRLSCVSLHWSKLFLRFLVDENDQAKGLSQEKNAGGGKQGETENYLCTLIKLMKRGALKYMTCRGFPGLRFWDLHWLEKVSRSLVAVERQVCNVQFDIARDCCIWRHVGAMLRFPLCCCCLKYQCFLLGILFFLAWIHPANVQTFS